MSNNQKPIIKKQTFPFYKTYIDMDCRKDIYAQNQFINIKNKNKTVSRYNKIKEKIINNKFRLYYFVAFIALFKLEPVYDYVFFHNKLINRMTNYTSFYLSSFLIKTPNSIKQQGQQQKIINRSQKSLKLAQIYYKLDKSPYPINIPNFSQNNMSTIQQFIQFFSIENNQSGLELYMQNRQFYNK